VFPLSRQKLSNLYVAERALALLVRVSSYITYNNYLKKEMVVDSISFYPFLYKKGILGE